MENLPAIPELFENLLKQDKIEAGDLSGLSPESKRDFMKWVNEQLNKLTGEERDAFIEKTCTLYDNELVWEYNHHKITTEVEKHAMLHGTMPSKNQLAKTCGLSRTTIEKHLKAYAYSPSWAEQTEAIHMMSNNVMSKVLGLALRGDLKAAKLYMEVVKNFKPAEIMVKNQQNYVQINSTVINQQVIQQLKPEQLQRIEEIIAESEKKNVD